METEFKNLKAEIIGFYDSELKRQIEKLNTENELKEISNWTGKTYKGNIRAKLTKYLILENQKYLNEKLRQLKAVEQANDFDRHLTVSIEWTPSRMWRSNPRAYTNFGFKGDSIGGCGYDKRSTALADGLNSHLPLLKLLYAKKDKALIETKNAVKRKARIATQGGINCECLGYGAGYNILPAFEGGVGFESHQKIIEGLGLKFESITQSPNSDTFIISKGD